MNKMDEIDVEYNYETSDDNKIFNTSSPIIVDLENFHTKVSSDGIVFKKHFDNTFSHNISNMVSHLKKNSKFKIEFEKLDPSIVKLTNKV